MYSLLNKSGDKYKQYGSSLSINELDYDISSFAVKNLNFERRSINMAHEVLGTFALSQ